MTTDDDLFWERLNTALDERRDPREDAELRERLDRDATARASLDRLDAVLGALAHDVAPAPARRTRFLAPLAAGLLGCAGLWRFAATAAPGAALAPLAHGPSAEVLRLEVTVVTERPGERSTVELSADRRVRAVERRITGEVSASITTTTEATLRPH